jgi:hypothetical protein
MLNLINCTLERSETFSPIVELEPTKRLFFYSLIGSRKKQFDFAH